jgi:iron only hydrogenase large subunit-like protein
MEDLSQEAQELISLLDKKTKMVAMLAPSFPVVFDYHNIAKILKHIGFEYVVEVARGAEETNKQLLALLKLHPDRRYITNPCPTIVRLIRDKYPALARYLSPIDSPMIATAKLVAKKYPNHKRVFIGPCLIKKLEAKEDYPELDIIVLTYKELQDILKTKNIAFKEKKQGFLSSFKSSLGFSPMETFGFDIVGTKTRLYPVSGGLSQSSGIVNKFTDPEYDVISGPILADKTLQEFFNKPELKILDVLNCEGGCINGPGIVLNDSLDRRRQKVINYWKAAN